MSDYNRDMSPIPQPQYNPRRAALLIIGLFLCMLSVAALLAYLMLASRVATGG